MHIHTCTHQNRCFCSIAIATDSTHTHTHTHKQAEAGGRGGRVQDIKCLLLGRANSMWQGACPKSAMPQTERRRLRWSFTISILMAARTADHLGTIKA